MDHYPYKERTAIRVQPIGSASVLKSCFVDRVNGDERSGRCGFVYEEGSVRFRRFRGNLIHLPLDTRILNAPEYVELFRICI